MIGLGIVGIGNPEEGRVSSEEAPALEKCPAKERELLVGVTTVVDGVGPVVDVILLKLLKMDADAFERLSLSGRMRLLVVPVRT